MLSKEQNEAFYQVRSGTPMGELLRNGQPMSEILKQERFRQASRTPGEFVFFAHQPEAIRQAYRRAMGLDLARVSAAT